MMHGEPSERHVSRKSARCIRGDNSTPRTEAELQAALNEEVADVKVCIRAFMNGGAIDNRMVLLIMNEKQK